MDLRDAALSVVRQLREAGHTAYFAGGCVRDLLLGSPPKDYDIATSAPPGEVRRLFRGSQPVGAAFGVILVREGGHTVEVATFRADGQYTDGRRPQTVRFSTPWEDARRRDFTINGLFLDPFPDASHAADTHDRPAARPESGRGGDGALTPDADVAPKAVRRRYDFGEVIDYVDGLRDLACRVLRAIGDPDERLVEDHLRLLRAVRFAGAFGLTVDPATARAVRRHAAHLRRIAPERVGEELRRMLRPPTRSRAWALCRELGLTPELFRFCACAEQPIVTIVPHLPDIELPFALVLAAAAIEETAQLAESTAGEDAGETSDDSAARPSPAERAVVCATLPVTASATARGLRQSLRLSNEETDRLEELLSGVHRLLKTSPVPPAVAVRRRLLARPVAQDLTILLEALLRAGLFREVLPDLLADLRRRANEDNAPAPLLTGDDLAAAGLRPGPVFKQLLDRAYDAQLEGRVTTRAEALAFALAELATSGPRPSDRVPPA